MCDTPAKGRQAARGLVWSACTAYFLAPIAHVRLTWPSVRQIFKPRASRTYETTCQCDQKEQTEAASGTVLWVESSPPRAQPVNQTSIVAVSRVDEVRQAAVFGFLRSLLWHGRGHHVWIHLVGAHVIPAWRNAVDLKSRPGATLSRVVMLVGHPQWPAYVLWRWHQKQRETPIYSSK